MRSINPTPESVRQLVEKVQPGIPVVMINLLRFRERADYPAEMEVPASSGRDAYAQYAREVDPILARVGGKVIWKGEAKHAFIAPDGETWDEVLLVAYPSRDAFLGMLKSPDYQAITVHRTAALADARLIATI